MLSIVVVASDVVAVEQASVVVVSSVVEDLTDFSVFVVAVDVDFVDPLS
jgi:hypothetical protein